MVIEFLGYVPFSDESEGRSLGERIVQLRHTFGIRQKDLARHLDVDPSTLGRWERNQGTPLERHMERLTVFLISQPPLMNGQRSKA